MLIVTCFRQKLITLCNRSTRLSCKSINLCQRKAAHIIWSSEREFSKIVMSNRNEKRIVVIGAGASGICAARRAIENGYAVDVYEQTPNIGGLWVYTDNTGLDEHGLPVHTSMYQNLITNRPVETMGYPGFDFPNKGRSFVPAKDVLEFLLAYVDEYGLKEKIRLEHLVVRVTPLDNGKWETVVKNLKNNAYETQQYDFVFVCNGHYHKGLIPDFPGRQNFAGRQIHSHEYRSPDAFKDENVVVIGGGPSGRDVVFAVSATAKNVYFSTHRNLPQNLFPANVTLKPDIKEFKENSVVFVDGSEANIDTTFYCTGYKYAFPFLSVDCGIYVLEDTFVNPLYKHCLNINKPSMALIGLQNCASTTLIFDTQIRLCFRYWNNEIPLPSKADMISDTKVQMQRQWDRGFTVRKAHSFGDDQTNYFNQLAEAGQMENLPEVLFKIYEDVTVQRNKYPNSYRENNYKIIDDQTFERIPLSDIVK